MEKNSHDNMVFVVVVVVEVEIHGDTHIKLFKCPNENKDFPTQQLFYCYVFTQQKYIKLRTIISASLVGNITTDLTGFFHSMFSFCCCCCCESLQQQQKKLLRNFLNGVAALLQPCGTCLNNGIARRGRRRKVCKTVWR